MILLIFKVLVCFYGLYWCVEVFGRFGKDLAELFGKSDLTTKGMILFYWALTAGFVIFIYTFVRSVMEPLLAYL